MTKSYETTKTWRFTEWLAIAAWGSSLLIFLTILISPVFVRRLIDNKFVTVTPGQVQKLPALPLSPSGIGALRVDVDAQINANEWVQYEIQLLDENGKVVASGIKEGWSETGTWYEEGESGTWAESDTLGGLDVRNKQAEKLTLAIALLGRGTTAGKEINQPVVFSVHMENGIVDIGALWFGLIGSVILSTIASAIVPTLGKKVVNENIQDSDPTGRAVMGGENSLIRVQANFDADAGSLSHKMQAKLSINNSHGEKIYSETIPIGILNVQKKDGVFIKATGQFEKFFILTKQDSYGFHVEILPDEPVDRTTLTIRDRARTLRPVEVKTL